MCQFVTLCNVWWFHFCSWILFIYFNVMKMQQFKTNATFFFWTRHLDLQLEMWQSTWWNQFNGWWKIINVTVYLMKPVQWQMELKHCKLKPDHWTPCTTRIEPYNCLIVIPREIFRYCSHLIVTRTWNNVDVGN